MKFSFLFLLGLFLNLGVLGAANVVQPEDKITRRELTPTASAKPLSEFQKLQALVASPKGQRAKLIKDFLPLLPKPYLQNYILIYQSISAQYGDQTHPRVLLFAEDASVVLAITGRPDALGEGAIEIIQRIPPVSSAHTEYAFHEINFPAEQIWLLKRGSPLNPKFLTNIGSSHNCATCHANGPITGFEPHPNFIPLYFGLANRNITHGKKSAVALDQDQELEALKYFMEMAPHNSRYSRLQNLIAPSEITPEKLKVRLEKFQETAELFFKKLL